MLNNFTVMGRLVATPELKLTPSGTSVCRFRIACDRNFKNSKGEYETDFFTCTAWRHAAESVSKNYVKGQLVVVEGEVHVNTFMKNEVKMTNIEITAEKVYPCGPKNAATAPTSTPPEDAAKSESTDEYGAGGPFDYSSLDPDDEELPF